MELNTELLEKALGLEPDSIEVAHTKNMDEDNIEYYLCAYGYDYPKTISKDELKLKCKENKINYNVLINILETSGTLEDIEWKMFELHENKYKYEAHIKSNGLLNLDKLSIEEIKEEIESFINCFKDMEFENKRLTFLQLKNYKDRSGNALYDVNGNKAFYVQKDIFKIPKIDIYRDENELVLDLLLNKLFHNAIK